MHVLRCAPTFLFPGQLERFDDVISGALSRVLNVDISGVAREQAGLPVRHGGLGIRLARELAIPAYLASVHSISSLATTIYPGLWLLAQSIHGNMPLTPTYQPPRIDASKGLGTSPLPADV